MRVRLTRTIGGKGSIFFAFHQGFAVKRRKREFREVKEFKEFKEFRKSLTSLISLNSLNSLPPFAPTSITLKCNTCNRGTPPCYTVTLLQNLGAQKVADNVQKP